LICRLVSFFCAVDNAESSLSDMKRTILLFSLAVPCALAQPPNLIRLLRQGEIQPYIRGQSPVSVLGMTAITGAPENWLIEMHDSFASLDSVDKMLGGVSLQTNDPAAFPDLLAQSRNLVASYRPDMSYRAEEGVQIFPKMRYMDVAIIRIRLGTEADLSKLLKLRSLSLDSINADRPEIVYEVVSGAPAGTYVVLAPMTSLSTLDAGRADTPVYAEAAAEAAKKIAADTELTREHIWLRIQPRLSHVSGEFASQDPVFWRSE
jgi:hypothetical protein